MSDIDITIIACRFENTLERQPGNLHWEEDNIFQGLVISNTQWEHSRYVFIIPAVQSPIYYFRV